MKIIARADVCALGVPSWRRELWFRAGKFFVGYFSCCLRFESAILSYAPVSAECGAWLQH